jgi:UDPglucose 6-dehydrogenase
MRISVVGLGKLGSPLLAVLASKEHQVIGVDINLEFVNKLNSGLAPVQEPYLQEFLSLHRSKISATQDYAEAILNTEVTFVIVPTPSEKDGLFSNRYILQAIEQMGQVLQKKREYHLVVITSTVTPGSTGGEIKNALELASQKKVGINIGLCYSPEFIALGTVIRNMLYPDMVLIGESDEQAGDILEEIYLSVCENDPPIRRMNWMNAEIAKIAINTFITTKISFANMLSDICQRLQGADVDVVTDALGLDTRIGSKYIKAAVGFGGPCFPRDNLALAALGNKIGARTDLALATQQTNQYQNDRLLDLIKTYDKSKKVGILGLSYKPGTYVTEESQGIRLANQLVEHGFAVSVYDPIALIEAKKTLSKEAYIASSVQECLERSTTLIIMIPWPEFTQTITPKILQSLGSKKVLVDCWRLFSKSAFMEVCDLVYLGCGNSCTFQDSLTTL